MKIMVGTEDDDKPCDAAQWLEYVRIDERTTDDPAKVRAHEGKREWWYNEGTNHRVENGGIKRDFSDRAWFIEINSLEDLRAFLTENYGEIRLCSWNPTYLQIDMSE